jgi:hypothetical protein
MATNTYVALDKVTVATATPSVTFTSIPQTYTDLVLVMSGTASGTSDIYVYFNADTASNYSRTYLYGDGSAANSGRQSFSSFLWAYAVGSNQNNGILNIQNYSNATTYKTAISRWNISSNYTGANVGLWRSTTAISSMTVGITGGLNLSSGTTFSLYGIKSEAVSPTAKATGGYIVEDSTYMYHLFTGSGTFTPTQSLTCDVLMVGGGGGAGGGYSGGGGAGGLRFLTSQSLSTTGYSVVIGAGGTAGTTLAAAGSAGSNTTFNSQTANGGGRGGNYVEAASAGNAIGGDGASGGGGALWFNSGTAIFNGQAGGAASPSGQGNAGGNGFPTGTYVGHADGGGGGAGAAGANGSNNLGGSGGIGLSTYSSWGIATSAGHNINGTYYFAGGGGGGSLVGGLGGYGGGGKGGSTTIGENGMSTTGGGGGGCRGGSGFSGGSGGSGVVIVRYAK